MSEIRMKDLYKEENEKVAEKQKIEEAKTKKISGVEYQIKYGSAFAIDQFGFIGRGQVIIAEKEVELSGKKHWSGLTRFGIFFAITILPLVLFGFGLGFLLAAVIVHYFCASPASIIFRKENIKSIKRSKKKITFLAPDKNSGKLKKSLFNAENEESAKAIEASLMLV